MDYFVYRKTVWEQPYLLIRLITLYIYRGNLTKLSHFYLKCKLTLIPHFNAFSQKHVLNKVFKYSLRFRHALRVDVSLTVTSVASYSV